MKNRNSADFAGCLVTALLLLFGIWDWFNVTVFKLWLITGLVCFFTFSVYALKMEVNKK